MAKITQVVALERGHDGRVVREPGEHFSLDIEDARFKGSTWFAPVGSPEARPKKAERDPKARPPGAGPIPGSAVVDLEATPGAGPLPASGEMV